MSVLAPRKSRAAEDPDLIRLERLEREAYAHYAMVVWDPMAVSTARTDAFACALKATDSVLAYLRSLR